MISAFIKSKIGRKYVDIENFLLFKILTKNTEEKPRPCGRGFICEKQIRTSRSHRPDTR